ncbi:MAG: zinc-ribbon domain-containing protein [Pararhodobacter sp.]
MRLTCPNCNAQYEVDEKVIPKAGRDVQCSACGHTWYQYPSSVALEMRAAELEDDEDDDGDSGGDVTLAERPATTTTATATAAAERVAPRIDKTVLDVLREEAERELGERKRLQEGLETQGDLGLTRPSRSKAAPSRIYGEDDPAPAPEAPDDKPEVEAEPVRRRKLLPDIEELSSTLEPGHERRSSDAAEAEDDADEKRGFRRGLSLVVLVALALILLYVTAPMLAAAVPALAAPLESYVGTVNGLRSGFADLLRNLLGG